MKKSTPLFILIIVILVHCNARAQVYMGMYGSYAHGNSSPACVDAGGGFELNFLSKETPFHSDPSLKAKQIVQNENKQKSSAMQKALEKQKMGLQVQFGGNFLYANLGRKTFYDVPLLAPQVGSSKVTLSNSFLAANLMMRFSYTNNSVFTPYADVFAGYRSMNSTINVTPYVSNAGRQTRSSESLGTVAGLNYGFGGGITASLGKRAKFDVGFTYSEALQNGDVADLRSAYADASGINLNMKQAPNGIIMFHIGLMFYIDGSHVSWGEGSTYGTTYYYPSGNGTYMPYTPSSSGSYYPSQNNTSRPGGSYQPSGGYHPSGGNNGYHPSGGNGGYHSSGGSWGGGGGGAHVGVHVGGGRAK